MEGKKPMHYILKEQSHVQGSVVILPSYSISRINEEYIGGLESLKKTMDLSELARTVEENFSDIPISYRMPAGVPDLFIANFDEGTAKKVLVEYRELDDHERSTLREGIVDAIEGYENKGK
jgi:hypothetical protein